MSLGFAYPALVNMELSRFFSKLYNEYLKLRPLKINELFGKFLYSKNAPGWYDPLSVFFEKDTFEKKFSWVYKKVSVFLLNMLDF